MTVLGNERRRLRGGMVVKMSQIFITVLNMSLTASYCIAVVIVLRFFLRRQPKIFSYLLWSVVFFRLLCPFSLSSAFSLVRVNTNIISQENMDRWTIENADTAGLYTAEDGFMMQETDNADAQNTEADTRYAAEQTRLLKMLIIAARIWIIGIVLLICYSIGTAYRFRRSLRQAVRIGENQYEAENITTPFVFGIIKPRIYLPAHLSEEEKKYVLTHEKIHIVRKDYLVKTAAYGTACIHWFNPLVWLAFVLMENDMEMSCDEAVLRKLGIESKKEYSLSLLSLSSEKMVFRGSPLAFGEGKVKSRVKNILSYRSSRLTAVIAVAVVLVIIIGGLMLNPTEKGEQRLPKEEDREKITELIENYADAFCGRDGAAIAAFYADEEEALANTYDMLDKAGGEYTWGFSSPWPDSYRYVIDWEHGKADIWYYAWTSDPHVTVWKEEKYYEKSGEEYRVTDGSLEYMDSISSEEEFNKAYRIQGKYLFVDYEENGFADAISYQIENGTSAADNTVYSTPETAAEYILNLTGGEGRVEGSYTIQAAVRYRFADGSEVMFPMYMVQENIWIVDVAVWNAGAPD